MAAVLQVANLSKSFGTLPVVQNASFNVNAGEVVGLTGSIGSGKSVLAMIIAGMYQADEGAIRLDGKNLIWPYAANKKGISVIHQKPSLDDHLDIIGNIYLGREIGSPTWLGPMRIINYSQMFRHTRRILDQLGMEDVSLQEKVSNLSGEQRQMVAIARSLIAHPRLVIIDEPTVLLSYANQQRLLGLIQTWRSEGAGILFSSSNLDHLFAVTDRIIILSLGQVVSDLRTDEVTREEMVNLLIGTPSSHRATSLLWDYDQYDRLREHTEKLRYHQMLLGKDPTSEPFLNRQLSEQLAEQVQALDQVNLALVEAQRRLIAEREQERKDVARELHDDIIQDLLSINYELEEMEAEAEVSPALAGNFSEVREGIRSLVGNLRSICSDLRPLTIDSLGLGAALKSHTREWSARTGIAVELNVDENLGRLPEGTELSIFRIIQEGLNNIWRHARATRAVIILEHTSPRTLVISLRDDGVGLAEDFDPLKLAGDGHFGLIGISERVALLGGRFSLQRIPEGGSLLKVEIVHPRTMDSSELEQEQAGVNLSGVR